MSRTTSSPSRLPAGGTLAAALWPAALPSAARAALVIAGGSALLALSAKVQVPLWPVPMTLQTLVVLLLGAACGWRLGAAAVAAYLVEGALGLPVFAGAAAGPLYLAGPTGGFLVGFLPAVVLVGWLAERGFDRSLPRALVAMALGHAAIFAVGLAWLALSVGPARAWVLGAAPFALATLLKTALAATLMRAGWRLAGPR
jgi:biotin transport system substrate-specific component